MSSSDHKPAVMTGEARAPARWALGDWGLIVALPLLLLVTFAAAGSRLAGTPEGDDFLEELVSFVKPLADLSPPALIGFIFANNALKALVVILFGIGLGLLPLLFLVANGLLLGIVIAEASGQYGALYIFVALAPHGVLELPAALVAAGLGLRLGAEALLGLGGRRTHVRQWVRAALRLYLRVLLPALLLAALLEVVVTPWVLDMVR